MVFNSKILLFGEYLTLLGGDSLLIPFEKYNATWENGNQNNKTYKFFKDYGIWISENIEDPKIFNDLQYQKDIENGFFLRSNIPSGYGLGSSGTVAASIFYYYFSKSDFEEIKYEAEYLAKLRNNFSFLESHFHGKSSGMDPLVSYLNKPIHSNKEKIQIIDQIEGDSEYKLFLLNSKEARNTKTMVQIFNHKLLNKVNYRKQIDHRLQPLNTQAVEFLLNKNQINFFNCFSEISKWQLVLFDEMISDSIREVWKNGLNSDYFSIKLCGAGGGGYYLGITNNFQKLSKELTRYSLLPINRII